MVETDDVAVLIPAYNPDEKLLALLPKLRARFSRIVLVDDGSVKGKEIFPQAEKYVEKILVHPVNRGKGAALKTGFNYIGECDVITADADGQHTPDDIAKVAEGLKTHRAGLVLGVRAFTGKVPFRSRFGNFWTRWLFFLMTHLMIRDTQTGLRGIPGPLVRRVASIPGERYEYEMAMLADARRHDEKPLQIPIETVYIEENATSHFNPILDTIRIYRSLFQFCLSSILSFLIDNIVYAGAMALLALTPAVTLRRHEILIALVLARLISSNFNYFYNRYVVFKRASLMPGQPRIRPSRHSYFKYWTLVLIIAALGYLFTSTLSAVFDVQGVATTLVKIVVETFLFFASYWVQKRFVFGRISKRKPAAPKGK